MLTIGGLVTHFQSITIYCRNPFQNSGCQPVQASKIFVYQKDFFRFCRYENINQRTNGPVNAHLISWPSKAQNIHVQNLENIWKRNDLDLKYSHTFIISICCLHLPTFRSQAAIVSEKSTVFTFSHRKA